MLRIKYETTDENFNWKISTFGLIFIVLRFWFTTAFFKEIDGMLYLHSEVYHTSFWISNLICLAMIFSFRVKPLNAVALGVLPSVFVTLFVHDIPLLTHPEATIWGSFAIGSLFWWQVLTIHTPIPFIALYMFITRKETLSRPALMIMVPVVMGWFFFLDDKENGTAVSGPMYILAAFAMLFIWATFCIFVLMYDVKNVDPLIAKVVHLKGIEWTTKKQSTLTNNENILKT